MSLPGSGKVFSTGPILQLPPGTAISSLPVEQRALYLDPHQDPDDPQLLRTDFSPTIIENSLPPIQLLMSQLATMQTQMGILQAQLDAHAAKAVQADTTNVITPAQTDATNVTPTQIDATNVTPTQIDATNVVTPVQIDATNVVTPAQIDATNVVTPVQIDTTNVVTPAQSDTTNVVTPAQSDTDTVVDSTIPVQSDTVVDSTVPVQNDTVANTVTP